MAEWKRFQDLPNVIFQTDVYRGIVEHHGIEQLVLIADAIDTQDIGTTIDGLDGLKDIHWPPHRKSPTCRQSRIVFQQSPGTREKFVVLFTAMSAAPTPLDQHWRFKLRLALDVIDKLTEEVV